MFPSLYLCRRLTTVVLPNHRQAYNAVFELAQKQLKAVFGMQLHELRKKAKAGEALSNGETQARKKGKGRARGAGGDEDEDEDEDEAEGADAGATKKRKGQLPHSQREELISPSGVQHLFPSLNNPPETLFALVGASAHEHVRRRR